MNDRSSRVLWSRGDLPTRFVSDALNVSRRRLGAAIHVIKRRSGLRGDERIIIYENGDVADERGDLIGNILDES